MELSVEQSNATLPSNQTEMEQSESPKPTDLSPNQPAPESTEGEEEEEEGGGCGFCLFIKAGACKDIFISWEKCVKEADAKNEDLVEKCSHVTALWWQCMEAHSDYYGPFLRAEKEKHAQKQAVIELEKEKQQGLASNNNNQQE